MGKITNITPEQQARFGEWTQKWIHIGLSTEPADFDRAIEAALKAYALCNLKKPMVVLRMGSPYAATMGGALAWRVLKEMKFPQVRDQVRAQVGAQVWAQVGAQVRDQVGDQVEGDAQEGFSNYGINSLWCSWGAHVSFFRDVMGWQDPILERFEIDEALMKSCGWTWWHQNVLAISDRPKAINRDDQGRLHCEAGPSIAYRDGWSLYHVHGVAVPSDIIEDPKSITVERIANEQNAEVRRVMIDRYGADKYVLDSRAIVVHSLPANHKMIGLRTARVLRKDVPGDEPIIYVDLLNSTPEPDGTTKRYMLRVDPNAYDGDAARNVHAAAASTWRNADGSLTYKRWQDYAPHAES